MYRGSLPTFKLGETCWINIVLCSLLARSTAVSINVAPALSDYNDDFVHDPALYSDEYI